MYIDDIYAPPIMALMARELSTLTILRDSDKRRIDTLTAELAAKDAEVKRLQGELAEKNAKPEAPSRKYKVGDRVFGNCGKAGVIVSINSSPGAHFPYRVLYSHGETDLHSESFLSPAPSEAPDAALPAL